MSILRQLPPLATRATGLIRNQRHATQPVCHAGGWGFKSPRPRQSCKRQPSGKPGGCFRCEQGVAPGLPGGRARDINARMSRYTAHILWNRNSAPFTDLQCSRGHLWRFDGGVEVPASASPSVVPLPMSVAAAVDPEEALVAALSSCHMLTFLSIAAKAGFVVDSYDDNAEGVMEKNAEGRVAVTRVTLRPLIRWVGAAPDPAQLAALHDRAHHECFIANSVKTDVRVESTG
jgi:organic hydroperoxide reductase OsmC/OhrA